ncbi:sigma 54-interacting transcriptional regulator [Hymenobacter sp. GOD-10R]|uniref:sigma 54-interacting transcriptional regulator n=1 Tax=Hymenobacter sp. GOD-10R TaxID=3093922 RepID=UPI002D78B186|nr:sigma 54-interacting transcriptional regulator [Hymenobacter sp. GOD-10R]WRQ29029.1 sigma 54-interacting transcriptional regulator [Hymenobacter sp. GOD-10R]
MQLSPSSEPSPAVVLIVEDEFLIANDLQRILEKAGYQVLGLAESVAAAQALVAQATPTIVLLDIFLKGEATGIDLAHWLRQQHIPFVYLSANLTDSVLEAAKVTEPFGFLNKPFREKDVLTTLEIARYRHAHSQEEKLRQQQQTQIAVNNAIISIRDRDQLCLAIAAQINQLVPFTVLNLRMGLPEEQSFYWVMLRKTALGTFERIHLPELLGRDAPQDLLAKLTQQAPDQLGEETGIFSGAAFEELCQRYPTARASRAAFGVQSMALFPVLLKQHSFTSLQLATTAASGFAPEEYEAVSLIIPQIALALDNLLVCEEVDERRKLKSVELAMVGAFQNGRDLEEIAPVVARALHQLLPLDLLTFYRLARVLGTPQDDTTVQRVDGHFQLLHLDEVVPASDTATRQQWPQALADLEPLMQQPTLNVGEEGLKRRAKNLVAQRYGEHVGLQSSMYVPITIKGRTMGALVVASRAAYAFTNKDLLLLQELSRPLGLALENLLAFERIKTLSEQLEQEKTYLNEEIKTSHNFEEIIGTSPPLLTVFKSIGQVAPTDATVLILGETGTGKELIARAVHNLSKRKDRTMVKVNCAALPPQLIESELFGHERGSFTGAYDRRIGKFELAHHSTIFLDEIGELPLEMQAKLLRVIQEKEIERLGGKGTIVVDVRIVAATNRNLQEEVAAGRFRADLYYRLNVFPMLIPPLRERPEDILPLAQYFLRKLGKQLGKRFTGIANASMQQLRQYAWPGNVRELEHVLERAAILSTPPTLALAEPLAPSPVVLSTATSPSDAAVRPMQDAMRDTILAALTQANNRIRGQGGAAELLGLKPTTLEARMKKLNISAVR